MTLWPWVVAACLGAEPAPVLLQSQGRAELYAFAPVRDGRINIEFSDLLRLAIVVKEKPNTRSKWPSRWFTAPAWRIVQVEKDRPLPALADFKTIRLTLEPLAPGDQVLDLAPIEIGPGEKVYWQPLSVSITARVLELDAKKLRDITAIEKLPPRDPEPSWWPWILAGSVALIGGLVVAWRLTRAPAPVPKSARRWALYELERLRKFGLLERDKSEEFCTLMGQIVRKFLELRYAVPARRATTEDLARQMQDKPGAEWIDWLRHCDRAKFSGQSTAAEVCRKLWADARQRIDV